MGLGDWLIATAEAKELNETTGQKVKFGDKKLYFYDKTIFANNPRIATIDEDGLWIPNYPCHRPYALKTENGFMTYNDKFKVTPGEIYFSSDELEWLDKQDLPKDFILVEPNVKNKFVHAQNKAWSYWEELLKHNLPWLQVGDYLAKVYTKKIITNDFREALLILSKAKLFVGTDGGLHHAAAALGIPAVVIWTGFSSPKHLGYDGHTNIHDGSDPCGTYHGVCRHCLLKANDISVKQVLDAVNTIWHRT